MRPCQLRYYTRGKAINRRARRGCREVQKEKIFREMSLRSRRALRLKVLGASKFFRQRLACVQAGQRVRAFVWVRACVSEEGESVPANPPARTFLLRGKRRPANRGRRRGLCLKSELREPAGQSP